MSDPRRTAPPIVPGSPRWFAARRTGKYGKRSGDLPGPRHPDVPTWWVMLETMKIPAAAGSIVAALAALAVRALGGLCP